MRQLILLFLLSRIAFIAPAPAAADTADFHGIAGNAASAVAVGPAAAAYFATSSHNTFATAQLPALSQSLRAVTHNENGTYFIVGDDGVVLRSTGAYGSAFAAETSIPTGAALYGVAKWPAAIVAVGASGSLIRSTSINGGGWVTTTTNVDVTLRDLVYGLAAGVTVGASGTILWGNNTAAAWTAVTPSPAPGIDLRGVARLADSRFIAVGSAGTVVIGTANGQIWSSVEFPFSVDLNDVAVKTASPSRIVAVADGGRIFYSNNNGADWTETVSNVQQDLRGVVFTGIDWLITGDHGTLLRSELSDGINWADNTATQQPTWGNMKSRFR